MCVAPLRLKDGAQVACRYCTRCKNNRINDWVGRCIAETKTADHAFSLTLTYSDSDSVASTHLQYPDVQKLLKRLRKAGFAVRYLCAGEYGSKRGRAHWHAILWFKGEAPAMPLEETEKQMWEFWPHGFTFVQRPDLGGFRYVCKYLLKDDGETAARRLAMSKKPTLGSAYFEALAQEMAEQGLQLKDWEYTFPEAKTKKGEKVRFWMQGRTREIFAQRYQKVWREKYGVDPAYVTAYADFIDRQAKAEMETDPEWLLETIERKMGYHRNRLKKPGATVTVRETDGTLTTFFNVKGGVEWLAEKRLHQLLEQGAELVPHPQWMQDALQQTQRSETRLPRLPLLRGARAGYQGSEAPW